MAEPLRSNFFQPAPPRTSTDPQTTTKRSHLRPHTHRHHHRHSSRHHAAKEAVQSAIQLHPPTSFGDLLNKAKGSGSNTAAGSRRESVQADTQIEGKSQKQESQRDARKSVRPEDVEAERRRVKAREEDLRSSLQNLSDQSLETSRRIDDTYYSLLERVSGLHRTLGNLQSLAGLTKELQDNFDSDTNEIIEDIEGQYEGFGKFEKQQEHIVRLETRIKAGREKADGLHARLMEAKRRVEARAKSEEDLETRNTRRLRILWGIIGAVALFILTAILFQQFKPIHTDGTHQMLDFASREKILDAPIPDIAKEAIFSSSRSTPGLRKETPSKSMTEIGRHHPLRVFDEL